MKSIFTNFRNIITLATVIAAITTTNAQLKVDAGPDINLCIGDYVDLRANITGGAEPYIISWSPDADISAADIESPSVSPSSHTIYKVMVTDANGIVAKDEVKVKVNPKPEIITNGAINVTIGESVALSAEVQGGTAPYTYTWKPTGAISVANTASPTITPKSTVIYNVTVKDAKGCTNTNQVHVTVGGPDKTVATGDKK